MRAGDITYNLHGDDALLCTFQAWFISEYVWVGM